MKKILLAGLLLSGTIALNAQTTSAIESSTETGYGLLNGALNSTSTGGTFMGYKAGNITTGSSNSFFGANSGLSNGTGNSNVFIGVSSGYKNTTGSENIFSGIYSGLNNTLGASNTFYGAGSGLANTTGSYNVYLGYNCGYSSNATSGKNVYLGAGAGSNNVSGAENVFIGFEAGKYETGSSKFYLANSSTSAPLVYGDFSTGKVSIGGMTTLPTTAGGVNVSAYKLFVKGGILTEEVRINLQSGWADYVFAKDYKLAPLNEVEKYIADNGHLPNVPSADQVKEEGIEVGQMATIQQEKIEELTLYIIQQQKEIDELKAAVKTLMAKK
jgi:hypothetical protein